MIVEGGFCRDWGFRETEEKRNGVCSCVVAEGEVRDGPMRWGVLHAKRKSDDRSAQWSGLVGDSVSRQPEPWKGTARQCFRALCLTTGCRTTVEWTLCGAVWCCVVLCSEMWCNLRERKRCVDRYEGV